METRKIQVIGGGTYAVSLPKEWAENNGITRGDAVEFHEYLDGVLAVQAPERERTAPEQLTVHLSQAETEVIEYTVRAAYVAGTKSVRFENPETFTDEQHRIFSRLARNLTGVSIVKDSETELTVKTLLDTEEVSVQQSVRQLRFVVLDMHRDATAGLERDSGRARLTERGEQADRVYAMISRSLSRGLRRLDEVDALGVTRSELFELWATTHELERVGEHAAGIVTASRFLDEGLDQELLAETQTIAETTRTIVSDAVSVVIDDAGFETAQETLTTYEGVRDDLAAFESQLATRPDDRLLLEPVVDRLRRTAEHGETIAKLGLQQAVRSGDLDSLRGLGEGC